MHELGIAQSIAETAVAEAHKEKAKKVTSIDVEVGELMQLDVGALERALELLMTGPMLEGAKVDIKVAQASFSCNGCGKVWGMDEAKRQLAAVPSSLRVREPDSIEVPLHFLPYLYPSFLRCPECGSSDTTATSGEDVRIKRVVLD